MKKFISVLILTILIWCLGFCTAFADSLLKADPKNSQEFYTIGSSENTLSGVYGRMHIYLDLNKYPIPEPNTNGYEYASMHEEINILKDDDDSFDYIGYVCNASGTKAYIIWSWAGYHEDGSLIGIDTYYSLDGIYLGNVQHDYSSGAALSSRNSPFFFSSGSLYGKK